MTAQFNENLSSYKCQLDSTIQKISRGTEGKGSETSGVKEWKVEKILNKRKMRSCEVSSIVKEIYNKV